MKKNIILLMILSFFCSIFLIGCGESDEEKDRRLIFEELQKRR